MKEWPQNWSAVKYRRMSAEFLEDEQPKLAAKKKKKRKKQEWWAQQQHQRGEKKRLLAIGDGEEKADEERWHEMSCAFVEEAAMAKAVAWCEGTETVSQCVAGLGSLESDEWWVAPEMTEAEESTLTENAAGMETTVIEHGGWCERQWNDQLTQSSME